MANSRREAQKLTTRGELELVSASYAGSLGRLSARALKSNIARTRKLRDKQRDLLKRQRLASRARTGTKQGSRPDSNARTAQKAELFDQTLSRFTKRLQALEASAGKAPKKKRRASGSRRFRGQAALRQKARTPRMKAIQAHVGSRGRRRQARRDSR